jgi:predicted kinase
MGSDKKSFVIEFNGLSGCGKTTSALLLAEKLRADGYEVQNIGSFLGEQKKERVRKIYNTIRWGTPESYLRLMQFVLSVKPFKKVRFKYARYFAIYFAGYSKFMNERKEGAFMVIDQGIVQSLISVAHLDSFGDPSEMRRLLEYTAKKIDNYICINCLANEMTAAERIISRKLNISRFDRMPEEEILRNSKLRMENFEAVRKCLSEITTIKCIEIDMRNSAEDICVMLYDGIMKSIEEGTSNVRN